MIKLNILVLLEKQGKTKYCVHKQLSMNYQNFNRIVNNETKFIQYENIEAMCLLPNYTSSELLIISNS